MNRRPSLVRAGGVVAKRRTAQRNDAGPYAEDPTVQVVVADNGVGVPAALQKTRSGIASPEDALLHALEPHVSGAFAEGRLLLASRGAMYSLDRYRSGTTQPVTSSQPSLEYPGTLVVFEATLSQIASYEEIIDDVHRLARQRIPERVTQQWLRFEDPPPDVFRVVVDVAIEDTAAAHDYASTVLEPRLMNREAIALDFRNVRVCTQSFLHALLHETIRLAWAKKVKVFVRNASPALRTQLQLVESYSLGG